MMKNNKILVLMIWAGLLLNHFPVFAQTIQITSNKREEFKKNYYVKQNETDTLYIVFDSYQDGVV